MKVKDLSESSLVNDLRDPGFAAGFLEEVLKDGSLEAFLAAVRHVVHANGGMKRISTKTKLGRESLYKALSENGNPRFSTLSAPFQSMGLRFSVQREKKIGKAA